MEQVLDEIDNTKLDQETRNEDFVSKNIRVKPGTIKYERIRTSETANISRRSIQPEPIESNEQDVEESNIINLKLFNYYR